MEQYIKKSALVAEIERIKKSIGSDRFLSEFEKGCNQGEEEVCDDLRNFLDTLEVKEVDLELITYWFDHIAQIADDRKTANGTVMEDWAALDEIKCLAKNSSEFIKMHYKSQKGE